MICIKREDYKPESTKTQFSFLTAMKTQCEFLGGIEKIKSLLEATKMNAKVSIKQLKKNERFFRLGQDFFQSVSY